MKTVLTSLFAAIVLVASTQKPLNPEFLWDLKRVGGVEVSPNGDRFFYKVTQYDINKNSGASKLYLSNLNGEKEEIKLPNNFAYAHQWIPNGKGIAYLSSEEGGTFLYEYNLEKKQERLVFKYKGEMSGFKYSPDGKNILFTSKVKLDQTMNDKYPNLKEANVHVFDDLMYRHWDSWTDYKYSHVFIARRSDDKTFSSVVDIMEGEKFDSPLEPFGGLEQINWNGDGTEVLYTCKKLSGKAYAVSTNSDIYAYNVANKTTQNITEGMMGYDMNPLPSPNGKLIAFASMEEDGFESDKNDIVVFDPATKKYSNLTADIDLTVSAFIWGDNNTLFFEAMIDATNQLFEIDLKTKKHRQITTGQHNYTSLALSNEGIVATKQSMKYPNEVFLVDLKSGKDKGLSKINDEFIGSMADVNIEKRMIKTTDGKDMLTWVIYPPNFDKKKKYPTLLYCQGGPQSAVSQFFSFRWNFRLMASMGYIVVAPNRRGLPGFGQEWNDAISGDWGGQAMDDYLSAIDALAKEPFVDEDKLGAVGASYGGYSVYYLAGIHNKRFKCFISHCGLFNLESWYGSTEELFFANKDIGGPYWGKDRAVSYDKHSPHNLVDNWDTPIMVIHGEKDYRVPITQGMEAYQAAQLKGIPSKFLYFPTESHWVLSPQNGIIWHKEFFKWLDKWLK